jgi:uncharacterized membrane protein YeaQ/YmgE (transglycosylase-associated protein family)
MQILGLIVIGIVIGILARLVLPGRSASERVSPSCSASEARS